MTHHSLQLWKSSSSLRSGWQKGHPQNETMFILQYFKKSAEIGFKSSVSLCNNCLKFLSTCFVGHIFWRPLRLIFSGHEANHRILMKLRTGLLWLPARVSKRENSDQCTALSLPKVRDMRKENIPNRNRKQTICSVGFKNSMEPKLKMFFFF